MSLETTKNISSEKILVNSTEVSSDLKPTIPKSDRPFLTWEITLKESDEEILKVTLSWSFIKPEIFSGK